MFLSFLQDPMHTTTKFISIQKQSKRKSHREKKETKKQEARTIKNKGTEYRARTIKKKCNQESKKNAIKKNMQKIKKMKLKKNFLCRESNLQHSVSNTTLLPPWAMQLFVFPPRLSAYLFLLLNEGACFVCCMCVLFVCFRRRRAPFQFFEVRFWQFALDRKARRQ